MIWNFDYDICAILFISTLIVYYVYRKSLPLAHNQFFLWLMISSVGVAVVDVVASIVCSYGQMFPIWFLYFINMVYYFLLALTPAIFAAYATAVAKLPIRDKFSWNYLVFIIPFAISIIILVATPWTHTIFSINDAHEFSYESMRPVFFWETIFYLAAGTILVFRRRNYMRKIMCYTILFYALSSATGHVNQVFFNHYTQTVSLANTIGLLIIFLGFQNPDYDRDRKTGMYRAKGIEKLKEEDTLYDYQRPFMGIVFENYIALRSVYGDDTAAHVIRIMARFLRSTFPDYDQFYVHNGRFIIICKGNSEEVKQIRDIVMKRCRSEFEYEGGGLYLSPVFTFSDGTIKMENHDVLRDSMRIAADEALRRGKGAFVRVTEEMHQKALRSLKIEEALKRALTGDGLAVYYQPIYSTKEKCVRCAEALVRIEDDELGLLFPDEFIWRAEKNGSILALGEQVFRKVCTFVRDNNMEELGLDFIEVNLSPLQCMREQLAIEFERIMEEYHVNPKYINLEITETATSDTDVVKENINYLSSAGVGFALDDYGTGYSNLVNVLSLPLSIVKIDKSIVWAYFNEGNDLLLRVIQTFEDKDLHLVVEGVETKEMAVELEKMGCHYEQGYYYSKPISQSNFLDYLRDEKWVNEVNV